MNILTSIYPGSDCSLFSISNPAVILETIKPVSILVV